MSSVTLALISTCCIFASGLFGLALRSYLPERHLSDDSKEAVKMGAGMIATLAALVLGLLVSSAKNSFDTMSAELTQAAAKLVLMDRLLDQYGPEAREVRAQLRAHVAANIELFWPEKAANGRELAKWEQAQTMELIQKKLRELAPHTDAQRALLAQAQQISGELLLLRWLSIEQAQNALPMPLLVIMLFWLSVLYVSFGLLAPRNGTVIVVLLVGALSISTAIFLILEMNSPLEGMMKVSSAPLRKALEHLGQ